MSLDDRASNVRRQRPARQTPAADDVTGGTESVRGAASSARQQDRVHYVRSAAERETGRAFSRVPRSRE